MDHLYYVEKIGVFGSGFPGDGISVVEAKVSGCNQPHNMKRSPRLSLWFRGSRDLHPNFINR